MPWKLVLPTNTKHTAAGSQLQALPDKGIVVTSATLRWVLRTCKSAYH